MRIIFLFLSLFTTVFAMEPGSKIFVAGHRGLVGSALVRVLNENGYHNLVTKTHSELDLTDQKAVDHFFATHKPQYVFLAAAKVGGIKANSDYPVDFFTINSRIQLNVLESAHKYGVEKLLFLGSSCIYPKHAPQPIVENSLLTGKLEPSNEPYALAKISGIRLCQAYNKQFNTNFISCMPTNLYGPGDNYDLKTSHVVPALIRKMVEAKRSGAKSVEIWGSGKPKREFLHVNDMAKACLFLMNNYEGQEHVNVGTGKEIPIGALAKLIQKLAGFTGELKFNTKFPDGTMLKRLDISKIENMGWHPEVDLVEGLKGAISEYERQNS
ncbi:MAG: GDP-L-fucose synthase [Rhabdochlamydiaceae bacterium]|nr:GDP-L-fucose synthase [Candidatus Amphrikana amoebophyrae]